jgi:hypothetical protein
MQMTIKMERQWSKMRLVRGFIERLVKPEAILQCVPGSFGYFQSGFLSKMKTNQVTKSWQTWKPYEGAIYIRIGG